MKSYTIKLTYEARIQDVKEEDLIGFLASVQEKNRMIVVHKGVTELYQKVEVEVEELS